MAPCGWSIPPTQNKIAGRIIKNIIRKLAKCLLGPIQRWARAPVQLATQWEGNRYSPGQNPPTHLAFWKGPYNHIPRRDPPTLRSPPPQNLAKCFQKIQPGLFQAGLTLAHPGGTAKTYPPRAQAWSRVQAGWRKHTTKSTGKAQARKTQNWELPNLCPPPSRQAVTRGGGRPIAKGAGSKSKVGDWASRAENMPQCWQNVGWERWANGLGRPTSRGGP